MTTTPDGGPTRVGKLLARRREDLDLTQGGLAQRIGITVNSVSAAERGRATISRSKRPTWEQALQLKAGTISRAYRDDADLEPADPDESPYANMTDRHERAIWEMDRLSEEDRRTLIDILRSDRRSKKEEESWRAG